MTDVLVWFRNRSFPEPFQIYEDLQVFAVPLDRHTQTADRLIKPFFSVPNATISAAKDGADKSCF